MKFKVILPVFLLILYSCGNRDTVVAKGDRVTGKVVSVIDGDTYDLLVKRRNTIRIRMEGIDAPERGMPFYRAAKNYLGELCLNKTVTVQITGKDGHNRYLGFSYLKDGSELGQEMIKAGLAWHFTKYSSDPVLSKLEAQARRGKKGLWIDKNPMAPWTNRSLHRQGVSTKDSFNILEHQR